MLPLQTPAHSTAHIPESLKSLLNPRAQAEPFFPDMTANYQQTVAIPQEQAAETAREAAQASVDAQAQQQASSAPQASYVAPPQPLGGCQSWMNAAGIADQAVATLVIERESGCNPAAYNASSGACGIPQALPCSKMPGYPGNPVAQLTWMQSYVYGTYGSWGNAWSHELNYGWY